MNRFLIIFFLLVSVQAISQSNEPDLKKEIELLKHQVNGVLADNRNAIAKIDALTNADKLTKSALDSLRSDILVTNKQLDDRFKILDSRIQQTDNNSTTKFTAIDNSLSKKSLYWIIAFLAIALISALAYFLLGRRINKGRFDVEKQIADAKKSMEEETVKLDTKLTELLDSQMKVLQAEKANGRGTKNEEADHSLALKVADEIVRINKNLSNMDSATKGIKQLSASVKRIEDNFAANGYEMPELLNKPFNSGMKIIVANSVPDENLKSGEELITRIIKPQVNYKGIMIQAAQVEVSVGQ